PLVREPQCLIEHPADRDAAFRSPALRFAEPLLENGPKLIREVRLPHVSEDGLEVPPIRSDACHSPNPSLKRGLTGAVVDGLNRLRDLTVGEVRELKTLAGPLPGRRPNEPVQLPAHV